MWTNIGTYIGTYLGTYLGGNIDKAEFANIFINLVNSFSVVPVVPVVPYEFSDVPEQLKIIVM